MLVLVDMLKGIVLIFRNTPAAPVASDSMISRAALAAFNMINDRWTSCADGTAQAPLKAQKREDVCF